jgi:hypothetical protein
MATTITRRDALKALAMGAGVAVIAPHVLPGWLQKIPAATRLPLKARSLVAVSLELLEDGAFPAEQFVRRHVELSAEAFGRREGRTFKVTDVQRIDQRWVDLSYYEDEFGVSHRQYPGQGVYYGELLEVV